MATIRDNQTGQLIQVDNSQLGQYGLSAPGATPTAQVNTGNPVQNPNIASGLSTSILPSFLSNMIAGAQQRQIAQRQVEQQQFQSDTQSLFDQNKGQNGYVSPDLYNQQKQKAAGLGIQADQFDQSFEHSYTDPTSIEYNTSTGFANRNAAGEIKRQIQSQIDQYNAIPDNQKGPVKSFLEQIGPLGQYLAPEATAYEQSTSGLAAQLKGLIGGTGLRVTQSELNNWMGLLPSPHDTQEVVNKKLSELNSSIKATFNTQQGLDDKYLPKQAQQNQSNQQAQPQQNLKITGIPAIDNVISNGINDIKGMAQGAQQTPLFGVNSLNPADAGNNIKTLLGLPGQILGQYARIAQNPIGEATQHPVNTALAVLGPLMGLKGAPEAVEEGAATEGQAEAAASQDPFANAPGKLQQILNPNKAKAIIGSIRDNIINTADKSGVTISGDDLAGGVRQWADQAKLSNLPDADAIEQAATNAEKYYSGQNFKPSDLKNIYDGIESGYTKNSVPKSATSSYIDRGLQQVLSNKLDEVAPGFQKTSQLFSQTYGAEKGVPAKIIRNLPQNAVKAGMNVAGLGILREFLGI